LGIGVADHSSFILFIFLTMRSLWSEKSGFIPVLILIALVLGILLLFKEGINLMSPMHSKSDYFVDVGESSYEHGFIRVSNQVYAITFHIEIVNHKNAIWERFLTTSNSSYKG
jgi:hypothetical protein